MFLLGNGAQSPPPKHHFATFGSRTDQNTPPSGGAVAKPL
uniref:Uncharacterized protein n=1 Tax=Anguilla anguilla TaxID=7936 RepID=A0A0E9QMY8_ANGAN